MGVSIVSEGFDTSAPYYRMPDSVSPSVAWITEGIDDELIGDFGLGCGGAAGLEIDRCDPDMGTPPHTMVIASSGGHTDTYILSSDAGPYVAHAGQLGTHDYRIRADMTFFTAPNNGAVFSASSIAFGMALPINNFDNNISRLLGNVVNAFINQRELPALPATAATPVSHDESLTV